MSIAAVNVWPVQDAQAHFSQFLQAALTHGPQLVTRRGVEAAVLVPIAQWKQLKPAQSTTPSIKSVLLENAGRGDLNIPPRQPVALRPPLEW